MANTFKQVLLWTLIWAFFATFLNYFLGMLVAIMINKKGIKFKKVWRTILVMTIDIPQFISLLYVSKMFAADGLINSTLMNWGWIKEPLPFWTNPTWAKVTIIGINVWIGIPYLMLIATGILMNIPADLYESARIDGANDFQSLVKIALPLAKATISVITLYSIVAHWNNYFTAMIYLPNREDLWPLQLFLRNLLISASSLGTAAAGGEGGDGASNTANNAEATEQLRYALIVISTVPVLVCLVI